MITESQKEEICVRVAYAQMEEFYPVVYLINKKAVIKRLQIVKPNEAASKHSIEYIISDLKSNEFEVIHIKDILTGVVYSVSDFG